MEIQIEAIISLLLEYPEVEAVMRASEQLLTDHMTPVVEQEGTNPVCILYLLAFICSMYMYDIQCFYPIALCVYLCIYVGDV